MEYPLSEEHRMFRETMQRFVDEEMIPFELETCEGDELKPEWRDKFHSRAKDLGIWKMEVPEEYGGIGADLISLVIVWEQLGRTIAVPTRGLGGIMGPQVRAPLYELSEPMKEKYLYRMKEVYEKFQLLRLMTLKATVSPSWMPAMLEHSKLNMFQYSSYVPVAYISTKSPPL